MASLRDQIKAIIDFRTPTPSSDFFQLTDAHALTTAEIAAGVTPVNFSYAPGNMLRYEANIVPGTTDMTVGLQAAVSQAGQAGGASVYIPDGTFVITAEVSCPDGIQITGAGKFRSILQMGSAAPNGAAVLRWANFSTAVHLSDFKILIQNSGKSQIGIRFAECRGADIERLAIFGLGTTADDTTAIQFDGTGTFTGAGTSVSHCYLSNHLYGIRSLLTATDLMIAYNTFYGSTGHTTSHGLDVANLNTGIIVMGNTFNFWKRGIYSESTYIKQLGNRFEDNNPPFEWVRGASNARIWGQSIGDSIQGAGVPIYPVNDVDQCTVLSGPSYSDFDVLTLNSERGYKEYQRTAKLGDFTAVSFSAGNFTASGAMTWTPSSGQVITYEWTVVGHKMTIVWDIEGSTIGGVANNGIRLAVPGGFAAAKTVKIPCIIQNNNVFSSIGMARILGTNSVIEIFIDATTANNWTLSSNTGTAGSLTFEVT